MRSYLGVSTIGLVFFIVKELLQMFPIPWFVVLLVSIPESFLVIILGFSLFNLRISYRKALLVAIAGSLTCYVVRLINTIDGVQTLIWVVIMMIFSYLLSKINLWKVAVATLSGVTIDGVIQSMLLQIGFKLTSQNAASLIANPKLIVMFFIPEAIIMLLAYIFVVKTNFLIFNGNMEDLNNETL